MTTPDLAPIVKKEAAAVKGCATYDITVMEAAEFADAATNGTPPAQVWIPDSPLWVESLTKALSGTESSVRLSSRGSIATSPIVMAVPKSIAKTTNTGAQSWIRTLASTPVVAAPPSDSTASLLQFSAVWADLEHNALAREAMGDAFFQIVRAAVPPDALFDFASKSANQARAFPASEQQIYQYNKDNPGSAVKVMTASSGSPLLSFTYVDVGTQSSGVQTASAALLERLKGSDGAAALRAAGLRVGVPSKAIAADVPVTLPGGQPPIGLQAFDQLRQNWNRIAKDMQLLITVDVSGSMKEKAGSRTRIALARDAVTSAVKQMPPTSRAGLWVFSTDLRPGGVDYRQVVPVSELGSGSNSHSAAVLGAARRLPRMLANDTGLYDTIWATYRAQQRVYTPDMESLVVIVTDGKNDDSTGGLSQAQLIARLKAAKDPKRPVRLVLIGMGGADAGAMRQVTSAVGGQTWIARNPNELTGIFASAVWSVSPGAWK